MPITRGARTAKELLRNEKIRLPIPVEKIAKKYAILTREALPKDVSGMLVPLPEMAGQLRWAIVVNKSDSAVRQRFTIAHELGHLLIHRYASAHADGRLQVQFRSSKSAKGTVREEIEANQFAAEMLMPSHEVLKLARRLRFDVLDEEEDEEAVETLTAMAAKFQVSVQSLSFRIANLGLA